MFTISRMQLNLIIKPQSAATHQTAPQIHVVLSHLHLLITTTDKLSQMTYVLREPIQVSQYLNTRQQAIIQAISKVFHINTKSIAMISFKLIMKLIRPFPFSKVMIMVVSS